jgi:hypothetical protein
MKRLRAQSTLEYVVLIGLAAAALSVMVPYIARAFRSNVREVQDNFSPEPYKIPKTGGGPIIPPPPGP